MKAERDLLTELAASDGAEETAAILQVIGEEHSVAALPAVVARLGSPVATVRRAAMRTLVALGDPSAAAHLMSAAEMVTSASEKRTLVNAVIALKVPGTSEWCAEVFQANKWRLRKKEALNLAEFADIAVLPLVADSTQKIIWEGKDGIQIEVMQEVVHRIMERHLRGLSAVAEAGTR